jgi:hypothetical protein
MKRRLFVVRMAPLAAVLAGLAAAAPAQAATTALSPSSCSAPPVSQLFLSWGDSNWYAMVPGESPDNFAGTGWTLSGGAKLTTQTLVDGSTGLVLDMPSGSKAVSPELCVGDGEPRARTLIRYGSGSSGSVAFTPYDLTTNTKLGTMQLPGSAKWSLSPPVNVLPGAISGWHIMQFTYVAGGKTSDFQIYDFGIDPRMRC